MDKSFHAQISSFEISYSLFQICMKETLLTGVVNERYKKLPFRNATMSQPAIYVDTREMG